ncbi:MAG: hypothetical protein GY810_02125 [Aureispira sp.]|nr:hypothetical protein [Aureispira sp.]
MDYQKLVKEYCDTDEYFIWGENGSWLTNKAIYSLYRAKPLRTALVNVRATRYVEFEGFRALEIEPVVLKAGQVAQLFGMKDAVKTRRLINEAIAKIPKEEMIKSTKTVEINGLVLKVPRSQAEEKKEVIKLALNRALGEADVEWLWVDEEPEKTRDEDEARAIALIILGLAVAGFLSFLNAVYWAIPILLMLAVCIGGWYVFKRINEPFLRYYGLTQNRIVSVEKDGKNLEQLTIASIQKNELTKKSKKQDLLIETARKKIKIPKLKFRKELHELVDNLKENSDQLRLLD